MPDGEQMMPRVSPRPSPEAAATLIDAWENGALFDMDDLMEQTDCPHGCTTESDAWCKHGWLAAGQSVVHLVP